MMTPAWNAWVCVADSGLQELEQEQTRFRRVVDFALDLFRLRWLRDIYLGHPRAHGRVRGVPDPWDLGSHSVRTRIWDRAE